MNELVEIDHFSDPDINDFQNPNVVEVTRLTTLGALYQLPSGAYIINNRRNIVLALGQVFVQISSVLAMGAGLYWKMAWLGGGGAFALLTSLVLEHFIYETSDLKYPDRVTKTVKFSDGTQLSGIYEQP